MAGGISLMEEYIDPKYCVCLGCARCYRQEKKIAIANNEKRCRGCDIAKIECDGCTE
jgi:hypothetical protein